MQRKIDKPKLNPIVTDKRIIKDKIFDATEQWNKNHNELSKKVPMEFATYLCKKILESENEK